MSKPKKPIGRPRTWENTPEAAKRRERAAQWYLDNKDRAIAKQARYREEIRQIVAVARDVPCADCGLEWPSYVMEFHHLDRSTKSGDVSSRSTPNQVRAEIAKCVIVCANCHRIREYEYAMESSR